MIKNKTILITGGAGFIGSNLCDYFINKDNLIVCLDNFSTGKKENIEHLINNQNFKLIEGDIRDLQICKNAVKDCDFVLHHAALGSVPRSINDPITTNEVNISGFLNMLVASSEAKIKRFVFAASSSTYGDSITLPKEEDIIGKPLSPYAVTKFVNELYADVFQKVYGLEYIGLRYFNVYGNRQDPDGAYAAVIPKFVNQFLNYKSPVINGTGENSRDFTYIENVIHMNECALITNNPQALNTIYNTAVGERTTLNDLINLIKKELTKLDAKIKDIPILYGPERNGDIPHSLANIDKAKKLLGYEPKVNLEDGIKKVIQWYQKQFTEIK